MSATIIGSNAFLLSASAKNVSTIGQRNILGGWINYFFTEKVLFSSTMVLVFAVALISRKCDHIVENCGGIV